MFEKISFTRKYGIKHFLENFKIKSDKHIRCLTMQKRLESGNKSHACCQVLFAYLTIRGEVVAAAPFRDEIVWCFSSSQKATKLAHI